MTEILVGLDLSTAWLGAARSVSNAASASRITRPAVLGKRDEVLAQMSEMLLDREAADRGPLSAIAIPKLGARSVAAEEFVLDRELEITNPAGDPREVLVGGDRPIDQHHHRGRVAVFIPEAPTQIEQDDGEILIGDDAGTQPVDQEPTILVARQHPLDLILLALIPEPPHGPRDGHRVIVEGNPARVLDLMQVLVIS
jgi:hypothetical protein